MVSFQFLPVASPSTLFWASRALSASLICKETIVEKWLSLRQTRQLAVHVHLLLRSLIYSATALICLSASDISPEGSALSSLSQNHLCCLYLLRKISRFLAETPFSCQPSKPGTLRTVCGGHCPCEYLLGPGARALASGPFLLFILFGCWPLFSWTNYALQLSVFLLERKKSPTVFKVVW